MRRAENEESSLRLCRESSFDLYMLDCWLGEGSGTNLCREIRECDAFAPIIVYSGAAALQDRAEALDAAVTEFVPKPYVDELLDTVRRLPETFEA